MQKIRRTADRGRISKGVYRADGPQEDTPDPTILQCARLVQRFGLTTSIAAVVAELAFSTREGAR